MFFINSHCFQYYIGRGNNSGVVRRVMSYRENWEEIESFNPLFNLKWQQNSRGYRFGKLTGNSNLRQLVNHFEYHKSITTKNGLIKTLSAYCEVRSSLFESQC